MPSSSRAFLARPSVIVHFLSFQPTALTSGFLALLLFITLTDSAEAQKRREGYLLHNETNQVYHFVVVADSTVRIEPVGGGAPPAFTLPPGVVLALANEVMATDSTSASIGSVIEASLDSETVSLRFVRPLGSVVLATLLSIAAILIISWVRISRRRVHRDRSRARQLIATRRLLTEGEERERQRVARELHDGPVQELNTLRLVLAQMPTLEQGALDRNGSLTQDYGAEIDEGIARVARELRAISEALRPPSLARYGLGAALSGFISFLRSVHPQLDTHIHLEEDLPSLSDTDRLALFRIGQEAMNNALRHGRATKLLVRLETNQDGILMTIEDNGLGFNPPAKWDTFADDGHFGLLGMSERAAVVGATLRIRSAPGQGTIVCVHLPLTQASPSRQS